MLHDDNQIWALWVLFIKFFMPPPTIVDRHYVFWSVGPFVRLSRFRLKFLVKVVFDEAEVQSTRNLVHMFIMIWSF